MEVQLLLIAKMQQAHERSIDRNCTLVNFSRVIQASHQLRQLHVLLLALKLSLNVLPERLLDIVRIDSILDGHELHPLLLHLAVHVGSDEHLLLPMRSIDLIKVQELVATWACLIQNAQVILAIDEVNVSLMRQWLRHCVHRTLLADLYVSVHADVLVFNFLVRRPEVFDEK